MSPKTTPQQSRRPQAAAPQDPAKLSEFRVKPNHTITTSEVDDQGDRHSVVYKAGETVKLSAKEAEEYTWALESSERRKTGQTSRLKRQVLALQQQVDDMQARMRASSDPELQAAAESMQNRGDNYIAKGEPTPGGVPAAVVDAYENRLAAADFDIDFPENGDDVEGDGGDLDTEKLSGGMKGLGKESTGGAGTSGTSHLQTGGNPPNASVTANPSNPPVQNPPAKDGK